MIKRISFEETLKLPNRWKNPDNKKSYGWENPNVAQKKYRPYYFFGFFGYVWEVDQDRYNRHKKNKQLCIKHKNKFYVA